MKPLFYILMTAALAAVTFNRQALPRRFALFIPLIALGIAVQLLAQFLPWEKVEKLPFIHVYQLLAYPLLAFYFQQTIRHRIWKWAFPASMALFYPAVLIYYLNFPQDWFEITFPEHAMLALMVVLGSLLVFYELYSSEIMVELQRSPDFWIGTANLIYYAGYLLTLGSYRYVDQVIGDNQLALHLIKITHWLNLLLYALYTVGFLCKRKTPAS